MTIYLLSGWLTQRFPGVDPLGHNFGHLWYTLLGFKGNPHLNPIHIVSNLLILGGFVLLSSAWRVLYRAQRTETLATSLADRTHATKTVVERGLAAGYLVATQPSDSLQDGSRVAVLAMHRADRC